jgi:hypothetical protein
VDEMSLVTIHPKRIRWIKNPWDVVSGFKHDNRLKCHRGIVSQWTFQVGLNVTVDETWVDITSRHRGIVALSSTTVLYVSYTVYEYQTARAGGGEYCFKKLSKMK